MIGDPGEPAPEVVQATAAAVDGVLSALPEQPVTLTLLAAGEDGELYLSFGRPPQRPYDLAGLGRGVPAVAGWSAWAGGEPDGPGWLEVRWRRR